MSRSMGAWTEPSELDVPQFEMPQEPPRHINDEPDTQSFKKPNIGNQYKEPSQKSDDSNDYRRPQSNSLLNIISSLFGEGGLDISTIMGFMNMFNKKTITEGSNSETGGTNTINLNDYKRVK